MPSSSPNNPLDLTFIYYLHNKALMTLSPSYVPPSYSTDPGPLSRERAKATLASSLRPWPSLFDEEWPSTNDAEAGVKYEQEFIG